MNSLKFLLCFGAALLLAACGRGGDAPTQTPAGTDPAAAPAAAAGEVVVYTARKYQLVEELFEQYTKDTGVRIRAVTDDAGPLIQKLKAEGANTPADVLITVDAGDLWFAAQEGLLAPVQSATLAANVPENLRDPENRWYGLAVRARTIAYGTQGTTAEQFASQVKGYADLADPKWKGKLCLRSSKHVYNRSLVAALIARYGEPKTEEIVKGWVANLATDPFSSDTLLLEAIAAGQCGVGIVNHYYLGRMIAEKGTQPIAIRWPDQDGAGVHVNISGAGLTAHAKNRDAALKLLEWLSTPEVQAKFAGANQEYPANPQAQPSDIVKGFGEYRADPISVAKVGSMQPDAAKLMDRVGWK
ncbi:MAG: extracellular solute-binding protein [Steroidobacteraceae bacterium]|jgi:iron(III) transport system substrate-binding protein|nr:extracellular solute-binding protein [Steroidobacteraceae bacterium]